MKSLRNKLMWLLMLSVTSLTAWSQQVLAIRAARVFDGQEIHTNWTVVVEGDHIVFAGPSTDAKEARNAIVKEYPNGTLIPGMIEGHAHLLLHPYNETPWDEQVMKESDALRVARATVHARKSLEAGFTTVRDLGSEGAGYADVGLKNAIDQGIIPGPRLLVAGRAIVATGSYGPKGFDTDFDVMLGAEAADGNDLIKVTRDQIGKGADIVKIYADYRWGRNDTAMPTFSTEEIKLAVETARSSGRPVVAHAVTADAMTRAVNAGVETIEHGDFGDDAVFALMKSRGVALCPTLAAGDAISRYKGWKPGMPEPERIRTKRESFRRALASGVTICAGGDVGVFAHGENARELELMVEYGMKPIDVLRSVTSTNARVFHLDDQVGTIAVKKLADLVVVEGDPSQNIAQLRKVVAVFKSGMEVAKN
ncbi:amidohydrolase family protein [Chryseolinea sp. T2]|uniref:metal-dependent hydrolase family protein n=1 Tax=Chryseolinea sp. T2 TaxID=3129255 RepID=UPI003077DBC6